MNFECCSTTNRKNGKVKKTHKYDNTSSKKTDHPEIVNCSYAGCVVENLSFSSIKKIARLGKRYYYFCDEYCYLTWLDSPSQMWL